MGTPQNIGIWNSFRAECPEQRYPRKGFARNAVLVQSTVSSFEPSCFYGCNLSSPSKQWRTITNSGKGKAIRGRETLRDEGQAPGAPEATRTPVHREETQIGYARPPIAVSGFQNVIRTIH